MNEKKALIKKLQAYFFAVYDWNLYLDTHPDDKDAIMMFRKMADKADALRKEYESKYGPLTADASQDTQYWNWLNGPWPWEEY